MKNCSKHILIHSSVILNAALPWKCLLLKIFHFFSEESGSPLVPPVPSDRLSVVTQTRTRFPLSLRNYENRILHQQTIIDGILLYTVKENKVNLSSIIRNPTLPIGTALDISGKVCFVYKLVSTHA